MQLDADIEQAYAELIDTVGPRGPAGTPPVSNDDTFYHAYLTAYRLGCLLGATIHGERLRPGLLALRRLVEARLDQSIAELAWKARADLQWLADLPDEWHSNAQWARNWFVRAGLEVPFEADRQLFAIWWRRFNKAIGDLVLTYGDFAAPSDGQVSERVPRDCDLELARYEISQYWRFLAEDAHRKGGDHYIHPSVANAWQEFAAAPSISTAERLCSEAPGAERYFVACAPGGWAYLADRLRRTREFVAGASRPFMS